MRIRRDSLHPELAPLDRRARGGSAVEYLLILALVVIPIAALVPLLKHMVDLYFGRIAFVIRLPFG